MAVDDGDGTLTARSKEKITEEWLDRLIKDNQKYLANLMSASLNPQTAAILVGTDFGPTEVHVLASISGLSAKLISIDEFYKTQPNEIRDDRLVLPETMFEDVSKIWDEISHKSIHSVVKANKPIELPLGYKVSSEPMKQNGRSAAYLKHDRSKSKHHR